MKSTRIAALAVTAVTAALCIAAVPASADSLYFVTPTPQTNVTAQDNNPVTVYKIDTTQPAAAPTTVISFDGNGSSSLAASCDGSVFATTATGVARINPAAAAPAATEVFAATDIGPIAVDPDGTRVWWMGGLSGDRLYTRALTADATTPVDLGTPGAGPWRIARVGKQLVLRSPAASMTTSLATAAPATFTPLDLPVSFNPVLGSNGAKAFFTVIDGPNLSIGTYDPATTPTTNPAFAALSPFNINTGAIAANGDSAWLFDAGQPSVAKVNLAAPAPAETVNSALPGAAMDAVLRPTDCGAPPASATAPTVTGTTTYRSTLTATPGTWTNAPTGFTYQWQRCTVGKPETCVAIPKATKTTRLLQRGDIGSSLRIAVTATNEKGSSIAYSALSAEVSAGSLAILPASRRAANPVIHVRVPSAGSMTFTGTAKVGGSTVQACARVKQTVAKGGLVHLTCTTSAAVRAARASGKAVTVKMTVVFKPTAGKSQNAMRSLVLRATKAPAPTAAADPVTG